MSIEQKNIYQKNIFDKYVNLKSGKIDFLEILNYVNKQFLILLKNTGLKLHCQMDSKLMRSFKGDAVSIVKIITFIIDYIIGGKTDGTVDINVFEKNNKGNAVTVGILGCDKLCEIFYNKSAGAAELSEYIDGLSSIKKSDYGAELNKIKKIARLINGQMYVKSIVDGGKAIVIEIILLYDTDT